MAFQLLFLIFGVLGVQSQYLLPARCNSLTVRCVGEGSSCGAQWNDESCQNYASTWSVCNKCADDSLTCHGGKCMKNTQGRGESCNAAQHLWCQSGLVCQSGTCKDPNTLSPPSYFLARGETCQQNSDCNNGNCDPFINKCVNQNIDATTGEARCSSWSDCVWGEYCSPQDTTTSPTIQATCKPVPGGFGNRGNSLCKPTTNWGNPTGQCGWSQFCVNANQDETDAGHTAYTSATCQQPYSIPEGGMCPPDIPAYNLYVGEDYYNNYPVSFCASGPCRQSGSSSVRRCMSADYTYAGTGCRSNDECGRGLTCKCPNIGGGRQRCMLDSTFQNWEQGRSEWFNKVQPWMNCLENNQCTFNDNQVGSCGQKHCKSLDQTQQPKTCATEPRQQEMNVPKYRGYADTIGAGAHALPTVLTVMLTVLPMLYAMIQ